MSKLRNSLCELCTALIFFCGCSNEPLQPIRSGEIWPDNNGEHINAHGGGVMYHDGTYYWFGENKCDTTSSAMVGVMCYSSRNCNLQIFLCLFLEKLNMPQNTPVTKAS